MAAPPVAQEMGVPTIVAIDFGTTYTGFAFIRPEDDEPTSFQGWPATTAYLGNGPKTPTTLSIGNENGNEIIHYGYSTVAAHSVFSFFKPLLVPRHLSTAHARVFFGIQAAERLSRALDKSEIDLATHYLRATWDHFVGTVHLSVPQQANMELVMTVPAGWPDVMAANLKVALLQAGILTAASGHRLRVLREPHAALWAMVREPQLLIPPPKSPFKKNDVIVGVDCGGLTMSPLYPLKMRPLAPSHGETYGLGLARVGFVQHLKTLLDGAGASWPRDDNDAALESFADEVWNGRVLRQYSKGCGPFRIEIPMLWRGNTRFLYLNGADAARSLDEVVSQVRKFIWEQYRLATYAFQRISGYWSAVARGAVMMAREAQRAARDRDRLDGIAARPYGILREAGTRWITFRNQDPVPGYLIPLQRDDFIDMRRPPVVQGDPVLKVGRLVVGRAAEGAGPRALPLKELEISVAGGIEETELEVLGDTGIGVDVEFAVRRGGVRLGPEDAQVDYHHFNAEV